MEVEKTRDLIRDQRQSHATSHARSAPKDVSLDHDLLLLLQALSQALEAESKTEGDDSSEFNHDDVVNAVAMFFDTILSSERCVTAARTLIGMLQLPVLKSASADGRFFSDSRHPARRFIKALYLESTKIEGSEHLDADPRYRALHSIVKRLVKEYNGDDRVFLRAYFEVQQLGGGS